MHLLWIAVLIQTLFFIVNDAHFYVLTFIGLSLILQAFSKNQLVFLLGPMIVVHLLFVYWPIQEGFKLKKKVKSAKKSAKKTAKKTVNSTTNNSDEQNNYDSNDEPDVSNPEGDIDVPTKPEPLDITSNTPQ